MQTIEVPADVRTADTVALEIRTLQRQAQGVIMSYAIEIGKRLEEAKAMLPHGEWGAWLRRELDYSPSTAQNFMRVYREYGDDQISLFGSKTQTIGNLPYTKALRLLAIPDEEEREAFIQGHDVEAMSTRELEEAIKARDKAREDTRIAREEIEKAEARIRDLTEALEETRTAVQDAEEAQARFHQELLELRERDKKNAGAVEAAKKAAESEMREKLEKAKKARSEAEAKRKEAENALSNAKKELNELKSREPQVRDLTSEEKAALTAEAVQTVRNESTEQLRMMEKKLAAADPDVTEFKLRYTSWQEEFSKMRDVLVRIARTDLERAAKLQQAVNAALDQMRKAEDLEEHGA